MNGWEIDDWTGCYPSKWKGIITPDAISHPAKFSSKLIRRIYDHMIGAGWLQAGDMIIDPFGGVALGALDAMRHGLRWRGIELESRFADLGGKNIDLWNKKFQSMPGWCPDAVLLQGDSRHLIDILDGGDSSVSSPPYNPPMSQDHNGSRGGKRGTTPSEPGAFVRYGNTEGQLEGMSMDGFDGAVTSPPYAESIGNADRSGIDWGKQKDRDTDHPHGWNGEGYSAAGAVASPPYADGNRHTGDDTPTSEEHIKGGALHLVGIDGVMSSPPYSEARIGQNSGQEHAGRGDQYGPTPGQLGAMKAEGLDAALASPPYTGNVQVEKNAKSINLRKQWETYRHTGGMSYEEFAAYQTKMSQGYGHAEGQMADMKEGSFEAAVSSPPFRQATGGTPEPKPGGPIDAALYARQSAGNANAKGYGEADGQLANMKEGDLNGAVTSPPYQATQVAAIPGSGTDIELRKRLRASGEWEGYNRQNDDNLGNETGDDFWMAARQIVDQVFAVLRPGGHAVWVVKGFVKDKKLVDFPGQWRQLCEASGFVMVHEHHALLVTHKGTSHTLEGGTVEHKTEAKSFFRRLAESKGSPRIDYETVLCMVKPEA